MMENYANDKRYGKECWAYANETNKQKNPSETSIDSKETQDDPPP